MADAFLAADFQDAPGVPQSVLDCWAEARDELLARGEAAAPRAVETLDERPRPRKVENAH